MEGNGLLPFPNRLDDMKLYLSGDTQEQPLDYTTIK